MSSAFGLCVCFFFFFNDTATTEIYTLSLHDALPISVADRSSASRPYRPFLDSSRCPARSEEHTSELQSLQHLVCRLLLEKRSQSISGAGRTCMRTTSTATASRVSTTPSARPE